MLVHGIFETLCLNIILKKNLIIYYPVNFDLIEKVNDVSYIILNLLKVLVIYNFLTKLKSGLFEKQSVMFFGRYLAWFFRNVIEKNRPTAYLP